MKKQIGLGAIVLSILLILTILHGCGPVVQSIPFQLTITPSEGHPPFAAVITASGREGGVYTYQVTGGNAVQSTSPTFSTIVDRWPWKCEVTWTKDGEIATSTIYPRLLNEKPVAHNLWLSDDTPEKGEDVRIDLRYLEHGCHNGNPLVYTGIEDPDYQSNGYSPRNDGFTYYIEVYDKATGTKESVYTPDRKLLGINEYVSSPYFRWFPGWSKSIPPYPFGPKCEPLPIPNPSVPSKPIVKSINVYVKEWGTAYHWVYQISTTNCTCKHN